MSDNIDDTLRWVRASALGTATRAQKKAHLYASGWARTTGNRFRSRDGIEVPFATAVAIQLQRDQEGL
jgi:hypothetical protein